LRAKGPKNEIAFFIHPTERKIYVCKIRALDEANGTAMVAVLNVESDTMNPVPDDQSLVTNKCIRVTVGNEESEALNPLVCVRLAFFFAHGKLVPRFHRGTDQIYVSSCYAIPLTPFKEAIM